MLGDDAVSTNSIELVLFTKSGGPLTKRISLVDDKVKADASACSMASGQARRVRLGGLEDLAPLIEKLDFNQAIALGALRSDLADEVAVATKGELAYQPRDGAIARTAENLGYVEGRAALVLLDYDTKGMPAAVAAKIASLGGFWGALVSVLPPLRDIGHVVRPSTSSGLVRTDTGEKLPGSSGVHTYLIASDGSDAVRFLDALHDRCWLAGLGWCVVSKDGKLLERSIIDRMVGQGERLVFEGPPIVIPPLSQDQAARRPQVHSGAQLDTRAACPSLNASEVCRKGELRAEEDRRLGGEAKQARAAYVDEEAKKLVGHREGMTLAEARAAVEKRVGGTLLADFILPWDNEDVRATVGHVLDNPDPFEGQTLADPIEGVDYGRCKAKVMLGSDGLPFINSFAHGHAVYRLRYDARSIRERIEKAADKAETFAKLMLAFDEDPIEEERLVKEVAKAEGVTVRAIRSKLDDAKRERDSKARGDANAAVERLNETYALVIVGDKTAVMKTSGEEGVQLLAVSAFTTWFDNEFVYHGTRREPLGRYWLSHPQRRQYEGLVFAPKRDVPNQYNLWRGFAVEPREGDCSKFLAHMQDNVCQREEALYRWVMAWLAHIFQKPEDKVDTSLALRGKQGVGKTKVGEVVGSLLGRHYLLVAEPRYVTGRFNAHMAQLLMLHADEAFWAGDRSAEGKLKDMISGKRHPIEFKGKEAFWVPNYMRLLVTGNPDWMVPAGWEERRFAVLDVGEDHMRDHPYFAAIDEEMNKGGREALLHNLLNLDLSKINLREVPKTNALLDQKVATFSVDQTWWLDVLHRGQLPELNEQTRECPKHQLHYDYLRRTEPLGRRGSPRSTETKLGMFLRKVAGPALVTDARDEQKRYLYRFPSLKECRARFAKMIQSEIKWEEPDADWEKEVM
jgi:hypothetical protein